MAQNFMPTKKSSRGEMENPSTQHEREAWEKLKKDIDAGLPYDKISKDHFELCAKHQQFVKEQIQTRSNLACMKIVSDLWNNPDLWPFAVASLCGWAFSAAMFVINVVLVVSLKKICMDIYPLPAS